jgi:hypothetical protein
VVEKAWLAEQLEAGASIEAIAREVGRDPSTVAYWVRKHGLTSAHAERHAARGPIDRELLGEIVSCELSIRDMADVLERSPASIRHWLRKHGLQTARAARLRVRRTALPLDAARDLRMCPDHGPTPFVLDRDGYRRCRKCRVDSVVRRRARVRSMLIAEAGGPASSAASTHSRARCSSTTWIQARSPSRSAVATRARSSACARRRASACSCARTATLRWRRELPMFP